MNSLIPVCTILLSIIGQLLLVGGILVLTLGQTGQAQNTNRIERFLSKSSSTFWKIFRSAIYILVGISLMVSAAHLSKKVTQPNDLTPVTTKGNAKQ